jgi:hypothetical protein
MTTRHINMVDGNGNGKDDNGSNVSRTTSSTTIMTTGWTSRRMTMAAMQGPGLDNGDWKMMMEKQQCDDGGSPATYRMFASAAPPIQGTN